MGYRIDVCLDHGKPSIKIWDVESQDLRLSWTYRGSDKNEGELSSLEIHRLFRKLLLLTLRDDLNNVRVFRALPTDFDS